MLSRVAENIYWLARYVERAEDTARLMNVTTNLVLDLPKKLAVDWQALIDIAGHGELYKERYGAADERNVVRFMVGDMLNPGSVLRSLDNARENARTIRDIIPREAWEQINHLFLKCQTELPMGLSQRGRHDYLRWIILGTQTITGILAGAMYHDLGYAFLRLGRNLERADMTTRIIDVRTANLFVNQPAGLSAYDNIQWMGVLKSLTAYQMYRRAMQVRVRRPDVLRFLFKETVFPRSVCHALGEVEQCLRQLPRHAAPLRFTAEAQRLIEDTAPETLSQQELHVFIDSLQAQIVAIGDEITAAYFAVSRLPERAARRAADA